MNDAFLREFFALTPKTEPITVRDQYALALLQSGLVEQGLAHTPKPEDRTLGEHIAFITFALTDRMMKERARK